MENTESGDRSIEADTLAHVRGQPSISVPGRLPLAQKRAGTLARLIWGADLERSGTSETLVEETSNHLSCTPTHIHVLHTWLIEGIEGLSIAFISVPAKVCLACMHACRQACRQAGGQAGRQAGRPAGRQAGRPAGRQVYAHTY